MRSLSETTCVVQNGGSTGLILHDDDSPVHYLLYGTLAVPNALTRQLTLSKGPILRRTTLSGGALGKSVRKYRAKPEPVGYCVYRRKW